MSQTPDLYSNPPHTGQPDRGAKAVPHVTKSVQKVGYGTTKYHAFTNRHLFYLLLFTIAAAAFRLWNLSTWSFWVDEAHTYRDVTVSSEDFWNTGTSRYPLSYLLLRWIIELAAIEPVGLTERFMRLPFAFFGIASVPALAIVARGMIGRRSALLASLFLAFSPWHIYWSQNARSYSLVLFLSLLAMGAAYQGFERRSTWRMLTAIVLFFLAGFSHPTAYAMVGAALIYFLIVSVARRERHGWLGGKWSPLIMVAIVIVLVPLVLPILQRAALVKQPEFSLFHLVQTLVYYVGLPVLVASVGGVLVLFDRGAKSAAFLTCMMLLPLLGLSVLSSIGLQQKVTAQYAFAVLPVFHMLAAVLVISLAGTFSGKGLRPLVLRLVPLAIVTVEMLGRDYLYFEKEYGWRPRWAEAVEYIRVQARESGAKNLYVLTTNEPCMSYYFDPARLGSERDGNVVVESMERWTMRSEPDKYLQSVVDRVRSNDRDLWVVLTPPGLHEKDVGARADVFLRKNFRQVRRLPNWTGPRDMVVLIYHLDR